MCSCKHWAIWIFQNVDITSIILYTRYGRIWMSENCMLIDFVHGKFDQYIMFHSEVYFKFTTLHKVYFTLCKHNDKVCDSEYWCWSAVVIFTVFIILFSCMVSIEFETYGILATSLSNLFQVSSLCLKEECLGICILKSNKIIQLQRTHMVANAIDRPPKIASLLKS